MGSASQRTTTWVADPPVGAGPLHYLSAMAVVAFVVGSLAVGLGHAPLSDAPTETQEAVLVDLPAAEAGSHPQGDEAPLQQAAAASAGTDAPQQPTPKPPDPVEPPKPATQHYRDTAPPAPAPAAVLEAPAKPPQPTAAPASAPQEAHQAGEAQASHAAESDAADAETRRASGHLVTLWQKAMMARLQAARHGLTHPGHDTGIVKIAFEIDRSGRLVSEHVAQGSGSAALDASALILVRRAAPYPTPPHDTASAQLSFVVPISFRR